MRRLADRLTIGNSKRLLQLMMGVALLVGVMGFADAAFGQADTATLTGTVTDMKGLAMAGVTVVVHNADTGVDHTPVMTSDTGVYAVPLLQPGNYDVTANRAGFATVQHKGIALQVGSTVRIDIEMPVAAQQSLVTVTTEAPVLETEKTEASQNVSETLVSNLPVSSRRWEQFALLTPGVVDDGGSGELSYHGMPSIYNGNSVDGANNDNAFQGGSRGSTVNLAGDNIEDTYTYSTDAIREFKVDTNAYSAELGQAAGGMVNAITRSGTSQFHADVFENVRNQTFNAFDSVSKSNAVQQGQEALLSNPVHQQNNWGGSVGGPIIKDKLFFFANADWYRKTTPDDYTTSTPNIAGLPCPTATTPLITTAQCNTAKNFILNDNLGVYPRLVTQDIELLKLDYQMNKNNHLSVVADIKDWKEPNGLDTASTDSSGVTEVDTAHIQDRFVIANWTMVLGSNKINELRYQWGVDNNFGNPYSPPPIVDLTNIFGYGELGTGDPTFLKETRDQVSDNFTFTRGRHTFKMGVDLNFVNETYRSANPSAGHYTYDSPAGDGSTTGLIAGCSTDLLFCDWLVDLYGVNANDGIAVGKHFTKFSQYYDTRYPPNAVDPKAFGNSFDDNDYAGYFEDTWKARPNITVNLGLRYDIQMVPPFQAVNNNTFLLAYYTSRDNVDKGGIQPRFGLAWNFSKNNVIRIGGGTFFAKTVGITTKTEIMADGIILQELQCRPDTTGICTNLQFPDLLFWQQTNLRPAAPFAGALTPTVLGAPAGDNCFQNINCVISGAAPDALRPRAYEFEAAFERQLAGNMSVSATYSFDRGNHLPSAVDENIAPTNLQKTYDIVNAQGVTQLTSTVPFYTARLDTVSGQSTTIQETGVNSMYNGFTFTLHKPFAHGLELLANYTLSWAVDDGTGFINSGGAGSGLASYGVLDPYNQRGEQGYSGTDNRHHFTASVVWQPDFAKNSSSKLKRELVNGWGLSTIVTVGSGVRYSAIYQGGNNPCLVDAGCALPGIGLGMTGGVGLDASNGGGRVSWLPRDNFSLPGYSNVDLRLSREFTMHERFKLALRAEAFNLFNVTDVLSVNSNAYDYQNANTGICSGHVNTCMIPVPGFQQTTLTTGPLLGSRQLQGSVRFEF